MSLKENISMVRSELNSEEKFFEQAVRTERFVKKYKKPLISLIVLVVIAVVVMIVSDSIKQSKIDSANSAFAILQQNPTDADALAELKESAPALFEVFELKMATQNGDLQTLKRLSASKDRVVSDLASYQVAANDQDVALLSSYANDQDAIYRDIAIVEEAVLLLKKSDTDRAHQRLKLIAEDSPLFGTASALRHYGIK